MSKRLEWWLEWTSTAILLVGVALTSWNIYPINLWVLLFSNFAWAIIGFIWKKWSLVVVQFVVTLIYVGGLINHYWQ